jgi:hypothetical protein
MKRSRFIVRVDSEFATDSPLEEARFELLVPPKERGRSEDANVWKRWYVFTRHRAATELVLGGRSGAE